MGGLWQTLIKNKTPIARNKQMGVEEKGENKKAKG